jgi:hypothetical protein
LQLKEKYKDSKDATEALAEVIGYFKSAMTGHEIAKIEKNFAESFKN